MIEPKIKEAWRWANTGASGVFKLLHDMATAYLDAEAGRRMAEFKLEHDLNDSPMGCADPRHTWTLAQWRAELERELDGD